jgi:hypothetical protein
MADMNFKYYKPDFVIPIIGLTSYYLLKLSHLLVNEYQIALSAFGIAGLLFGLINKYLWKYFPFKLFFKIKDVSGKYTGTINYEYWDKYNILQTGSKKIEKVITQTGSSIVINTTTFDDEFKVSSNSESKIEHIDIQRDGSVKLIYNYLNNGNTELRLTPHYGTEILHFRNELINRIITGEYFTDRLPRQTRGKIELIKTA